MSLEDKLTEAKQHHRSKESDVAGSAITRLTAILVGAFAGYRVFRHEIKKFFGINEDYIPILDPTTDFISDGLTVNASSLLPANQFYDPDLEYLIKRKNQPELESAILVHTSDGSELANNQVAAFSEFISSYFGIRLHSIGYEEYEHGFIDQTDAMIVYGVNNVEQENPLLSFDAIKSDKPVFWMGYGVETIAENIGLELIEYNTVNDLEGLEYNNTILKLEPSERGVINAGKNTEVISEFIGSKGEKSPAITVNGRVYYAAFNAMANLSESYTQPLILDALSNIFGKHDKNPRVLLRLEDINSKEYGLGDRILKNVMTFLTSEEIPLHLGLIPSYIDIRDSTAEQEYSIWGIPYLADFLENPIGKVMLIQHGTHHHRDDPRNKNQSSGEATEFFPDDDLVLGPEESVRFARKRLVKGYNILGQKGIFPQAFEAPHYDMSPNQREFSETLYPLIFHPIQYGERGAIFNPTLLRHNTAVYGPIDIGYIVDEEPQSVDNILKQASDLKNIMSDPLVTVMVHPWVVGKNLNQLKRLVYGLKDIGYEFDFLMDNLEPSTGEKIPKGYVIPGIKYVSGDT